MSQRMWMKLVVAAFSLGMASSAAYATDATVIGDAYVNSAHPTTNYGTLSNLYVGAVGAVAINPRSNRDRPAKLVSVCDFTLRA